MKMFFWPEEILLDHKTFYLWLVVCPLVNNFSFVRKSLITIGFIYLCDECRWTRSLTLKRCQKEALELASLYVLYVKWLINMFIIFWLLVLVLNIYGLKYLVVEGKPLPRPSVGLVGLSPLEILYPVFGYNHLLFDDQYNSCFQKLKYLKIFKSYFS